MNAVANRSVFNRSFSALAAASSSNDATGKSQATENTISRDAPGASANETHTAEYASEAFKGTSKRAFGVSSFGVSETHSPRASNARQWFTAAAREKTAGVTVTRAPSASAAATAKPPCQGSETLGDARGSPSTARFVYMCAPL